MVAFHAFFWPSCMFFIGLCILLKVYYLKKTQKKPVFMPEDISCETIYHNNVYHDNYHETKESLWQIIQV